MRSLASRIAGLEVEYSARPRDAQIPVVEVWRPEHTVSESAVQAHEADLCKAANGRPVRLLVASPSGVEVRFPTGHPGEVKAARWRAAAKELIEGAEAALNTEGGEE